jgi:2,5-diketo-D-gluconate reductase A
MALSKASRFSAASFSMPAVGLGTYLMSTEQAKTATLTALAAGYRHIDTAQGYRNEAGVGSAIRESGISRDEIFVTTKLWPGNAAWGDEPKSFDATIKCCQGSLDALGLDYVDLYLIHAPFPFASGQGLEQWKAMLEIKKRGMARAVGVSNFGVPHMAAIESAGLELPAANQLEIHPLCQQRDTLAWMAERKILPIAYSSLVPLSSWRVKDDGSKERSAKDVLSEAAVKTIATVAARSGMSEAQTLLRWALQRGFPILPKSNKKERILANIDLFGERRSISSADMAALDGLDAKMPVAWSAGDPMLTAVVG